MKQWWAPFQNVPSVSPPCHTKVTLLMAEICDLTSDSWSVFRAHCKIQNTLSISKYGYLQLRTITIIKWRILRWIILGMYRIMVWIVCSVKWRNRIVMCREWIRGRQRGERIERCGGAVGNIGVDIGDRCQWLRTLRCCHWSNIEEYWRPGCHGSALMTTICIGVCYRLGRVFFVSATSLLSTPWGVICAHQRWEELVCQMCSLLLPVGWSTPWTIVCRETHQSSHWVIQKHCIWKNGEFCKHQQSCFNSLDIRIDFKPSLVKLLSRKHKPWFNGISHCIDTLNDCNKLQVPASLAITWPFISQHEVLFSWGLPPSSPLTTLLIHVPDILTRDIKLTKNLLKKLEVICDGHAIETLGVEQGT